MLKIGAYALAVVGVFAGMAMGAGDVFADSTVNVPAAAGAAQPVDVWSVIAPITSEVVEIVVTVLGVVGLLLARKLDSLMGWHSEAKLRDIEASHRDALHSAIATALGQAIDRWGPRVVISPDTQAGQLILTVVKASVPEAVAALHAADSWIAGAAASKLTMATLPSLLAPPKGATTIPGTGPAVPAAG